MKRRSTEEMTSRDIVVEFIENCKDDERAWDYSDVRGHDRLLARRTALVEELKRRDGDQRKTLLPLYRHESVQVRLMAARVTLAVAPREARAVLERIRDSRELPYALHAGMALFAVDEGIYTPS